MLFKKKTLDEKMEKYVKHHDWYAIQEVITGSKEEKIAAAKALGASDDQTSVDLLLMIQRIYLQECRRFRKTDRL